MFTEKFALLNLLQALGALSAKQPQGDNGKESDAAAENAAFTTGGQPEKEIARPNVMATVLERHEAISNRLRNKR